MRPTATRNPVRTSIDTLVRSGTLALTPRIRRPGLVAGLVVVSLREPIYFQELGPLAVNQLREEAKQRELTRVEPQPAPQPDTLVLVRHPGTGPPSASRHPETGICSLAQTTVCLHQ